MSGSSSALERVARTGGYLLLGLVGTAALAVAVVWLARPLQSAIYDALYLAAGPSEATEAATVGHFLAAILLAVGGCAFLGSSLAQRRVDPLVVASGVAAVVVLLLAFLALSVVVDPTLAALVVLGVALVGLPAALWHRVGGRSGSLPAFAGGVPVVVLVLVLAGFGLGWGWGYVLTATEVPASSADGTVADFDSVPEVREDLFAPDNCERNATGARRCLLRLREYEHERAATRFLARHGVRCPYVNARNPDPPGAFVARHDGTRYRVTCHSHGD